MDEAMAEEIAVPCEHCGKEGYDRVYLKDGHAFHRDCNKDVCVPSHEDRQE